MLPTQSLSRIVAFGAVAVLLACDHRTPVGPEEGPALPMGPRLFYDETLPPGDPEPTNVALSVGMIGPWDVSDQLPMPYPAQYTVNSVSGARTSELEFLWFTSVCNLDTYGDCSETMWADTPDARGAGMTTFTYHIGPDVRQLRVHVQVRELSNSNYRAGAAMHRTKGPRFWDNFVSSGFDCFTGSFPFADINWTTFAITYWRYNRCTGQKQTQ